MRLKNIAVFVLIVVLCCAQFYVQQQTVKIDKKNPPGLSHTATSECRECVHNAVPEQLALARALVNVSKSVIESKVRIHPEPTKVAGNNATVSFASPKLMVHSESRQNLLPHCSTCSHTIAQWHGCKESTSFEWVTGKNLGNMLQSYFEHIALKLLRNCSIHFSRVVGTGSLLLPRNVVPLPSSFLWIAKNVPSNPDPDCALWHGANARVLHAISPVIQHVTAALISKSKYEDTVVIHFRCSDSPANRHWGYEFVKYDYYKRSLHIAGVKRGSAIRVLACSSWHSNSGDMCDQYARRLVEVLQQQSYNVSQECETVEEDFAKMVHAPVLISGGVGSSLAYMAALASNNTAVLPTTVPGPGQRPSMKHHNYKTRPGLTFLNDGRLPHSFVKDYKSVKDVHNQLLQH